MFSKNGFLRTEGALGCGVSQGVMGQASHPPRVRPIFNRTPQGVQETYAGTVPIPNLIKRSKKRRR